MVLNEERIDKIWALDPEHESFETAEYWHRLNLQDASLVEVWLTSHAWLDNFKSGDKAIGHLIYCITIDALKDTSLHRIAADCVTEDTIYPAHMCETVDDAKRSSCDTTKRTYLGGEQQRRPSLDKSYLLYNKYSATRMWTVSQRNSANETTRAL